MSLTESAGIAIQRGPADYSLEVSKGNVPGVASVNKFGKNIEIDQNVTADIWSRGKTVASGGTSLIWVAPTQARTHTIASTDSDDTDGGAGARTVKIWGLQTWSSAESSETVTMDTGTPPVTSNSYVIIHRMKVLTTGGGAQRNQGLITATATSDSTVTAAIEVNEGQTMMAIYGVPSNKAFYMTSLSASVGKAGGASGLADINFLVNEEPDSQLVNFSHQHHFGLATDGNSFVAIPFDPYKKISGPAIIKVQAVSGTNNMDVAAWFNGFLVDE